MNVGDWVRSAQWRTEGEVKEIGLCYMCAVKRIYILVRGPENLHGFHASDFTVSEPPE